MDQGVDAFKTDFGERIPVDGVVWHDGSDPQRMHNYYAKLYNEVVFRALERRRGKGEAVVFARSATAGCAAVPGALGRRQRLDVRLDGGVAARRSVARDVGLRLLEPRHRRLRGHPGCRAVQALARVRTALVAFAAARLVVGAGAVGVRRGGRGCRARVHAAEDAAHAVPRACRRRGARRRRPDDASAWCSSSPSDRSIFDADCQYMLGDALLVAPVFTADGTVEYYLPEGAVDARCSTAPSPTAPLGARAARLRLGAAAGAPRHRAAARRDRRIVPTTTGPRRHAALLRAAGRLRRRHDRAGHSRASPRRPSGCAATAVGITARSDDARAPWSLQVGDRIVRAEGAGDLRIELEANAR